MSKRRWYAAGFFTAVLVVPALAQEQQRLVPSIPTGSPMVQKIFSIADLVVPVGSPGCDVQAAAGALCLAPQKKPTSEGPLMRLITQMIAPNSWDGCGGRGRLDYFAQGMALIVRNDAAVVSQVEALLEALRRIQDISVVLEIRLIRFSEPCLKSCGLDRNGLDGRDHGFVDASQLRKMLEIAQADSRTSVMCMPRITLINGQTATVACACEEVEALRVEFVTENGTPTARPMTQKISVGPKLSLQATASADRRFVCLNVRCECVEATYPVGVVPAGHRAPAASDAAHSKPVAFSQKCEGTFCVSAGQSLVLRFGAATNASEDCASFPCCGFLPPPLRFPVCKAHSPLVLIVTPRIIVGGAPAEKQAHCTDACAYPTPHGTDLEKHEVVEIHPVPPLTPQVYAPPAERKPSPVEQRAAKLAAKLVEKYYTAVELGEPEKARKYARQAVDLDPACFAATTRARHSADAGPRIHQLLHQAEDSRSMRGEWQSIWYRNAAAPHCVDPKAQMKARADSEAAPPMWMEIWNRHFNRMPRQGDAPPSVPPQRVQGGIH